MLKAEDDGQDTRETGLDRKVNQPQKKLDVPTGFESKDLWAQKSPDP